MPKNQHFQLPYGKQCIDQSDIDAVVGILRSDWLTQGPVLQSFEKDVSSYCDVDYAVAVSSGTAALHLACMAAGLKSNDSLWTSPNTFVASANCGLYCGAHIDFVDIHPRTYNMDVDVLAQKLKMAAQQGKLPKIVVPVHFSGQPCDMERIRKLADCYGFIVIEDACHAIGATYKEEKVGACYYSDMTVFSFHPVKVITSAEGGIVTTNREEFSEKIINLRTHGIVRDERHMSHRKEGPWDYQQISLGYNYRLSELHAALGRSQIKRLDEFLERRRYLANRYSELLEGLPLQLPWLDADRESGWHLYVVCLCLERLKKTRKQIFEELHRVGIGVQVHYIPVHYHPYYQSLGYRRGDFPCAEDFYDRCMSLPFYPLLSDEQQDFVVSSIKDILQ